MTLDEFRRTWIRNDTDTKPATPPPARPRLKFIPTEELSSSPRIVFREVFAAPAEPRARPMLRRWSGRLLWAVAALGATGAAGAVMAKAFAYAPTYIDQYLGAFG